MVIIQATKGFHHQMHPVIMMNLSAIPKGYTEGFEWVWLVKRMEMGLKFSKIKGWCQNKFKTLMRLLISGLKRFFFFDQLSFGVHC